MFFSKWINKGQDKLDEWEKLFSIVGGGSKVYLISGDTKDCKISRSRETGDWHVQIHKDTPTEIALHEACHQLYSTFTLPTELQDRMRLNYKSFDLANIMEDVRINRKGGDWYSQDLLGFQRGRLRRNKEVTQAISRDVSAGLANEVFGLGRKQENHEFKRVLDKFHDKIWEACDGDDALATCRVACEIMEELEEVMREEQNHYRNTVVALSCQKIGEEGANDEERDGDGHTLLPEGTNVNPQHHRFKPDRLGELGKRHGPITMLELEQEPIIPNFDTQLFIESQAKSNFHQMTNVGQPTHRIWQMNQGKMRVFEKPEKRKGSVLVMVDLSGSMGCWCEEHREEDKSGYIAFQVVKAITARAEAEVYGFCCDHSDHIVPLKTGYQPLCRAQKVVPSGNPDCAALMWMGQKLKGLGRDALAIFISDGQPAGSCQDTGEHTKLESAKLGAEGVTFANILINTEDSGYYPSAIQAQVTTPEEISNIQPVLDLMTGQWG